MTPAEVAADRSGRQRRRTAAAATVVPEGPYCYAPAPTPPEARARGAMRIAPCPFHKPRDGKRGTWRGGFCRLLKVGDATQGLRPDGTPRATVLLHDMVKECGINPGEDPS